MEQLYKVVFTGQLTPGADREDIISSLNRQFGTSVEKARKLLGAGKRVDCDGFVGIHGDGGWIVVAG